MPVQPPDPPPEDILKIKGLSLLIADPGPLDTDIGRVTGTLDDGTEHRQTLGSVVPGTVHVSPDGRTWTAVREQIVNGKVVPTPNAVEWKCLPESFAALIARLLALLLKLVPGLTVTTPLPAGTVGPEVPIDAPSLERLFVTAGIQGGGGTIIWQNNLSELQVFASQIKLQVLEGLLVVSIPVSCDQVKSAIIQVPFAVGSAAAPAGILVATEEMPRGPDSIVKIWGEALVAFAWHALLTVLTKVASKAGVDEDGAALIPVAITAGADGIKILTQARQSFDRVPQ